MPPSDTRLSLRGAALVRAGHPFVGRADLAAPPAGAGDVVLMRDGKGALLGTALYSAAGRIALRVLSLSAVELDEGLLRARITAAHARRTELLRTEPLLREADAYRVVHGEADRLPGLFIDRYGEAAVIQTTAPAMDRRKGELAPLVAQVLGARLVVLRDDGSAREQEGLPREKRILYRAPGFSGGPLVRFHDAGVPVEADLLAGSKTGSFLDQQENHARVGEYARALRAGGRRGAGLDTFTYHGGFALQLARAGLEVLACDESPEAIEAARASAALSGLVVDFQVRNAFDLLRELEAGGARFLLVVVDPPALAKRGGKDAAAHERALRAYKELNLRALRLLAPGGLLASCSCSGRISPADFDELLRQAARDAGRPVQVLERRGAGRDHPPLLGVPETEYLKCWILRGLED